MHSRVSIVNVEPLETVAKLTDPLKLKVAIEVHEDLQEEIEFSVTFTWTGLPLEDQLLDTIQVGPLKAGKYQFELDVAKVPDYSKVKDEDVTETSLMFLTGSYKGSRFVKVGFFVIHEYADEVLSQDPPSKPLLEKLVRKISTKDVRVTEIPIKWSDADVDFIPLEKLEAENAPVEEFPVDDLANASTAASVEDSASAPISA